MNIIEQIKILQETRDKVDELETSLRNIAYTAYTKWCASTNTDISFYEYDITDFDVSDECIIIKYDHYYCGCCAPVNESIKLDKLFFTDISE